MRHFQRITTNMIAEETRYERLDGKQYLVVPTVMLTEGVHAGSQGPLLYLNEHIGRNPEAWNHKPTVVYHPVQNGMGVSACTPDVIERQGVGLLMNSGFPGKLRTESWLDEPKCDKVDPRILPAIRERQSLNGSTGLWHDLQSSPGKWNGQDYLGVVTNILPDHWAILPDQPGACKDAGLLRNEAVAGISYDDIRQQVYMLVKADAQKQFNLGYVYCYVMDIFQKYAIVEINDVAYSIPYSIKDGVVKIGSEWDKVRRINTWLTVNNSRLLSNFLVSDLSTNQGAGNIIPKDVQTIQEPTMSATNPTTTTTNNTPPILTPQQVVTPTQTPTTPPVVPTQTPAMDALIAQLQQTQNAGATLTVDQYIASAPPAIQSLLRNALQAQEQQKAQMISIITANKANRFSPDWLKLQSPDMLTGLALLAGGGQAATTNNHALQGEIPMLLPFATNSQEVIPEPPPLPVPSILTAPAS